MPSEIQKLPPIDTKDYSSFDEFKNLNCPHKTLVVVISVFIGLLTLGFAVAFATPLLIGRFRKMELEKEASKQAETAKKVDAVVNKPANKKNDKTDGKNEAQEDIYTPEILLAIVEANEREQMKFVDEQETKKFIDDFWRDQGMVGQILDELAGKEKRYDRLDPSDIFKIYKARKEEKDKKKYNWGVGHESLLFDEIKKYIDIKDDRIKFPYRISPEEVVDTFQTVADGSCLFHALIGEPDDKGIYRCDEKKAREQYVDFLRKAFEEKKLPNCIDNALDDYFDNFVAGRTQDEHIPEGLKKAFKITKGEGDAKKTEDLFERHTKNYPALSRDEKDARKNEFKYDADIINAYLNYIKNTGTFIMQSDIEAVAKCFDKKVRLFQQDWVWDSALNKRISSDKLTEPEELINKDGKDLVCIYFKARNNPKNNHYERAGVRSVAEKPAAVTPAS